MSHGKFFDKIVETWDIRDFFFFPLPHSFPTFLIHPLLPANRPPCREPCWEGSLPGLSIYSLGLRLCWASQSINLFPVFCEHWSPSPSRGPAGHTIKLWKPVACSRQELSSCSQRRTKNLLPFLINHIPLSPSLLRQKYWGVSLGCEDLLKSHSMFYPLIASLSSSLEVTGPYITHTVVEVRPKRFWDGWWSEDGQRRGRNIIFFLFRETHQFCNGKPFFLNLKRLLR